MLKSTQSLTFFQLVANKTGSLGCMPSCKQLMPDASCTCLTHHAQHMQHETFSTSLHLAMPSASFKSDFPLRDLTSERSLLNILWLRMQNGWSMTNLVGIWHVMVNMVNFADLLLHVCYIATLWQGLASMRGATALWHRPAAVACIGSVAAVCMARWLPHRQYKHQLLSAA